MPKLATEALFKHQAAEGYDKFKVLTGSMFDSLMDNKTFQKSNYTLEKLRNLSFTQIYEDISNDKKLLTRWNEDLTHYMQKNW